MNGVRLVIVVPCYNEEEVLKETTRQLSDVLARMEQEGKVAEGKILYVDDGSKDTTWKLIEQLSESHRCVAGLKLAHNVGHQQALWAGLDFVAAGDYDAAVSIDADLQDDVNAIVEMVDYYNQGADVVFGVRRERKTDTFFKKHTAQMFYKLMRTMGGEIVYNHADFRLMSKRSLKALVSFPERNLFLRGMVCMLGYPTASVYYDRKERFAGESKYPFTKMLNFGRNHFFLCQTITPDYHIRAYLYAGFFPGHYLCFGGVYWRRRNPRLDFATHFCLVYRRRYPDCRRSDR